MEVDKVKLAFCLFKYFPYGGLQRDFLRIVQELLKRGHTIDVYTMQWEGPRDPAVSVHIISPWGWQNHTRSHSFVRILQKKLAAQSYDCVVGFNKMPGLDVYYAADTCFQAKTRKKTFWYRLTPRYRHLLAYEKAVFSPDVATQILMIAPAQQMEFTQCYATPAARFHLLPPGIARDRMAPANAAHIRETVRANWQLNSNDRLVLLVGSGFKTKGLDRILHGIATLPDSLRPRVKLWVVGSDNPLLFLRQAKQLGILSCVTFLGGRDDVPQLLLAADLLLHPAYNENTGTVLLEAIVAGLPVLTTAVCGYAPYITQAEAWIVLPTPFRQAEFNEALLYMLLSPEREKWQQNGLAFAKHADIYRLPERAADIIESLNAKA